MRGFSRGVVLWSPRAGSASLHGTGQDRKAVFTWASGGIRGGGAGETVSPNRNILHVVKGISPIT